LKGLKFVGKAGIFKHLPEIYWSASY